MALAGGGLSLLSSFGQRQATKKANKMKAAQDLIANQQNEANTAAKNKRNLDLGKALLKAKEVTTTKESGSNVTTSEHGEGEESFSETHATTSQDETHDNYSYVDTEAMMAAADKAGFNPVTWLNAGGLQAYTQTGSRDHTSVTSDSYSAGSRSAWSFDKTTEDFGKTTTETKTGHNAAAAYALMSPESAVVQSTPQDPVPSITSGIADAGTAALKMYQTEQTKLDSQAFQSAMLDKQLAAIQASNKNRGGNTGNPATGKNGTGNGTPSVVTSGGKVQTAKPVLDVNTMGMDPQKVETINPWQNMFGGMLKSDPDWPSGQSVEDELGETPWSWVYPPFKKANDLYYSKTGQGVDDLIMQIYNKGFWPGMTAKPDPDAGKPMIAKFKVGKDGKLK